MDHDMLSTQTFPDLSLAGLKKARKQIELDAQILANRIALLKQEELKSWKKIEETKKKAREVYLQKKRHEEKQQEKIKKTQTEKLIKMQSVDLRKQTQQEREFIREAIQNQKMQEMNQIRQLREINEKKRKEIQLKQLEEKSFKHDEIRLQQENAKIKKHKFYEGKINRIKQRKETMKRNEEKVKQQRELEVLNMERLELELISKLQQTQQLQKAAFEELEVALAEKPNDYEQKFMKKTSKKQQRLPTGGSDVFSPLSVKKSEQNEEISLMKGKEFSTEQFFTSKQYIKGQPDRNVEEVEQAAEQHIQLRPEVDKRKDILQTESTDEQANNV